MKWIVKSTFKAEIMSQLIEDAPDMATAEKQILEAAEEDGLEDFKIIEIVPFVVMETPTSVN